MFSPPISWRISNLIANLTKENEFESIKEVNQLLQMIGEENRTIIISSLLDELDFTDSRNLGNKDPVKFALLQEELIKSIRSRPNFASIMCQAVEGGERSKLMLPESKFPEELVLSISKYTKLSSNQTAALAFALAHSRNFSLNTEALRIFKSKISELNASILSEVHEQTVRSIVVFLSQNEELVNPEISGKFFNSLRQTPFFGSNPGVSEHDKTFPRHNGDIDQSGRQLQNNPSISAVLVEIGSSCSSSTDSFRRALKHSGIALTEEQVAGILVTLVIRVISSAGKETDEKSAEMYRWNLEVVAEVLEQECRGLNWTAVARFLDQPHLVIRSEIVFQLLTRMFVKISRAPLPAAGLMTHWTNKSAQLAMLVLSANAPRNIVDFTGIVSAEQQLPQEVPIPPNFAWLSLPLYNALLQLASSGLALEVLEAITLAANTYPEYVTVCLAQVQDTNNSGVRAEILRRTLPLFTGLQGSRPTSFIVMKKLMAINPELLVLLFRISLKRAATALEISEIDSRLRTFGVGIMTRLEEEAGIDEILGYLCVKADRNEINLEQKISMILESNPQNARALVNFAKAHAETLRPRSNDGGLLSFESFAILLRSVNAYPNIVSMEEVRALANVISNYQSSLQPALSNPVNPNNADPSLNAVARGVGGQASEEVEEEANAYFQKIYTSDISIDEVIFLLKKFKSSTEKREQEIFRCMIHNLYDEYRFFHKYPDKELHVTGKLFGSLIHHQLVSSITLGIALRYVLEALRKDPEHGESNEKLFRFGRISLEQFRGRLVEWPQYCSHLIQIPHLAKHCRELFDEAQRALGTSTVGGPQPNQPIEGAPPVMMAPMPGNVNVPTVSTSTSGGMPPLQLQQPIEVGGPSEASTFQASSARSRASSQKGGDEDVQPERESKIEIIQKMALINAELVNTVTPSETVRDKILMIFNNIDKSNMEVKTTELKSLLIPDYFNWLANYLVVKRICAHPNLHSLYLSVLDAIDNNQLNKAILDSAYHNSTKLLINPVITSSSSDRSLLRNLGIWLGLTTLARNKPILQRKISLKDLLCWGYETGRLIAVCSFVAKIIEGCRDSKIFRPPNPWLMSILGVLRELYEVDDLKMNIKFEVQVLCKNINVKIEEIPKGNVLSKVRFPKKDINNPDFNIKAVPAIPLPQTPVQISATTPTVPSNVISSQRPPTSVQQSQPTSNVSPPAVPMVAQSPSYNSSPSLPASVRITDNIPEDKQAGDTSSIVGAQEQTVIPNLASFIVINPSLQFFTSNPAQRRLVSLAVDRAIRELIQPVVERSVTIASVTTKQLVLKDFSTEPNEQQLRHQANLMISNLAGSLALVTCKEPLRLSICNHLRSLLASATNDQSVIEHIVQVCSNDNLDLGCMLIEKAAMEKALRDIDEGLGPAYQLRRKNRETGQPFLDPNSPKGLKYPRELPESLKPRMGGLVPQQLQLYEGFQRQRISASSSNTQQQQQQQQQGSSTSSSPYTASASVPNVYVSSSHLPPSVSLPPSSATASASSASLTMAQALEGYQQLYARIDMTLRSVQAQVAGREISLSMLGTDNDILNLLREIIVVTQRTQPAVRNETALTFAENIFKRLLESIGSIENLRAEVMVGILEAIKDVSGGPKKLSNEMIAWLNNYSTFNINDENTRKVLKSVLVLLLRAKLFRSQDIDVYFSTYMDGGRNMVWVELALGFVKQCLSESLALTYEFANIFDTVSKIRPANANVRKQLQKILTELRALATTKEEEKMASAQVSAASAGGGPLVASSSGAPPTAVSATSIRDTSVREHVTVLLEKWLRVWTSISDTVFGQYLQLMHQYGVLKTEEAADRFFRIATELCVDACIKSGRETSAAAVTAAQQNPEGSLSSGLTYTVVDALSKLFILLMRLADKESSDITVRVNLLGRILNAVAKTLLEDHESKKINKLPFDQRPYFRLLSNLALDLGIPDLKKEPNPALLSILAIYSQIYLAIQPSLVPGFSLAWLQLISQRCFLPHLLLVKNQKGWPYVYKLITSLFTFLQPFLKNAQLNDASRKLYKGALRVMLVLLHDFPEFLCEYYLILCDLIPITCVQLRNLVLSAFPRSIRLPDPFTPNLKIELIPEVAQPPRLLGEYFNTLTESGVRQRIDAYMNTRQPADLPALLAQALVHPTSGLNGPLANSLIVYVGSVGAVQLLNKAHPTNPPALDIFKALLAAYDAENRYYILNFIANQLRYPNSHTHFFSNALLTMFLESNDEFFQEQITRVLLERLIVHRPHPWGLLITFIELIKNPKYSFWMKKFTHCAPEIERVFESVAKSCIGSAVTAVQQQQTQQQGQGTNNGNVSAPVPSGTEKK